MTKYQKRRIQQLSAVIVPLAFIVVGLLMKIIHGPCDALWDKWC